jgi:DNA polymerase elongation subunit (family B)
MILQPIDWHEHDIRIFLDDKKSVNEYVIDVYGRLENKKVGLLRITGFKPYFYTNKAMPNAIRVSKYDVMAGFQDLKKTEVYKVECTSKMAFHMAIKTAKGMSATLYESNLPPFLRMFHERNIGPASPIKFKPVPLVMRKTEYNIDEMYTCNYTDLEAADATIPLLVACYDLEMYSESGLFPQANKDPIVQIGISYRRSTNMLEPIKRLVFVNGTVTESEDETVEFVECTDEEDMLRQFVDEIRLSNPDIICGYNTFGFDDAYIEDRLTALGLKDEMNLCRCPPIKMKDDEIKFSEKKKFELASGKYDLRMLMVQGRLGLDLLLNMRREHSLDSFKLDNVANVFLRDKVLEYTKNVVTTKSTRGLRVGNYVRFDLVGNTTDPYRDGDKFLVTAIDGKKFTIDGAVDLFADLSVKDRKSLEWTFTKDDVSPQELFDLHANGGPEGRARIARYCIQDCDLVLTLMGKLDTLVNARGMADVCKVPMQYVLTRGQGIKIFSAVVFYASQRDQIIETQQSEDGDGIGYEGAIVLSPKIGMYLDQPISVLDFNSLYPSNMIAYNLSPDTLVYERDLDINGFFKTKEAKANDEKAQAWISRMKEKGFKFEDIDYDIKDEKGVAIGKTVCTFLQQDEANPMTVGILPKTLDILLKKRKEFKQKMEDEQYDEAQRSVFNGLQLAYKVVANSVYGQAGSRTSPIRKTCVAASTTAAGRNALYKAKRIVESDFGAEVIYGDTDSIFIKFPTKDLAESIRMGIEAGKSITKQIGRNPYKIAYEKTLFPFILFCRKRYVGMKYEEDPNPAKAKRMSMGIVLKRRDNAPIVKDVFGGALDILLQGGGVKKAQQFVSEILLTVFENKIPLEKFIVSKSLRDDYAAMAKDYEGRATLPAHRVLADRMAARDPGTAPKVGDRLQYVYVAENKHKSSQGDRIEHVDYVKLNKLTPDTQFYITNQIQNPVAQLFALCIDQLDGYEPKKESYDSIFKKAMEKYSDEEEATLAVLKKKEAQLDSMMFLGSPVLSKKVKAAVRGPMDAFIRK